MIFGGVQFTIVALRSRGGEGSRRLGPSEARCTARGLMRSVDLLYNCTESYFMIREERRFL